MGNSFLLIIAGLLLFYLVISDKWKCVEGFGACVLGKTAQTNSVAPTGLPTLPNLPTTPPTISQPIGVPTIHTAALNSNWVYNNVF